MPVAKIECGSDSSGSSSSSGISQNVFATEPGPHPSLTQGHGGSQSGRSQSPSQGGGDSVSQSRNVKRWTSESWWR